MATHPAPRPRPRPAAARRVDVARGTGEAVADSGPPEALLGFLLNQLGGIVRERTARELAPLGMSPRALGLLLALGERPGSSQTELGRSLRIDRTTMSQLVDELTRAKLVRRKSLLQDRRSNQLELTAKGRKSLKQGFRRARQVEDAITGDLKPAHLAAVRTALLDMLERCEGP